MMYAEYKISNDSAGYAEFLDNCWNFSITANIPGNNYAAEYTAGFIQGKLQHDLIPAARDNSWSNMYYCDPSHSFPKWLRPGRDELATAQKILLQNYTFLCKYIQTSNSAYAEYYRRLLFRMLGIYHAMIYEAPLQASVTEQLPVPETFNEDELNLRFGTKAVSFMDIYFINAQTDISDVISNLKEGSKEISRRENCATDRCSAFIKRTGDDIYITHNTWSGFLSQSLTITYCVNGTFITENSSCPGQFGSNTDFGFNGAGICFNETTHRYGRTEAKTDGIWLCWRSAAAELFADSTDRFYEIISSDNTGTYLSGFMVLDVLKNDTALVEMSHRRFVYFKSSGGAYTVTDSLDGAQTEDDYDGRLLDADHIFGINYPVSYKVVDDLESTDNRPMRRIQFAARISTVNNIESARALITYTDPDEPLSLYGRWDLGYGTTDFPKTIPDGSIDAKACSASMIRSFLENLKKQPDRGSTKTSFWMKYGTPEINGKPFIWSQSKWKGQLLNQVPDSVSGSWHPTKVFME
jgi:hypothetical protein